MFTTLIKFRAHQADGDQQISFWVEAPGEDLPEVSDQNLRFDTHPLLDLEQMRSDPAVVSDIVEKAGDCLFGGLTAHANARFAFQRTVQAPRNADGRQIVLEIPSIASDAQNLPWELLHNPVDGFLEVNSRVAVVRAVNPKNNARGPSGMLGADGLRILSVIAAHNVPGHSEWLAMRSAIESYGHEFRLKVLVSEPDLRDEIANYANARADDWIKVVEVPNNQAALIKEIRDFSPQICHFFCHGRATSGGYLEIANSGMEFGAQHISLMSVDLEDVLPGTTWLVLLNACSGAEADSDAGTSPLAYKLVREGIPIVVGMRAEVPSNIIARFTETFLSATFATIASLRSGNDGTKLDLSKCLTSARRRICESFAETQNDTPDEIARRIKEWSLPVMNVRKDGFMVSPGMAHGGEGPDLPALADRVSELKTLKRMREMMDEMLNEDQKQQIDDKIVEVQQAILNFATGAIETL